MTTEVEHQKSNNSALFKEIAKKLRRDIRDGVYKIGDRLPSEHTLCEQFKASRHTIRASLNCLQEDGLINRRQGAGTVVVKEDSDGRFHNSINSLNELVQFAENTKLEILSVETVYPSGVRAQIIGVGSDEPWIRVLALRRDPMKRLTIGYTEIYVPIKFKSVIGDIGVKNQAIYELIENSYDLDVTHVDQVIEAQFSDADVASRLNIDPGDPMLLITRHYYDSAGNLVEVAISAHPSNRFQYSMTLTRTGRS